MFKVIFENYLLQVLFSIGLIIFAGLLIWLINRFISSLLGKSYRPVAIATGIIGTPLHELGHAAMCLLFGHKIVEMKLFSPDLKTGVLGYVSHSYNPKNIYHQIGNFFIGVAPIFSCGLGIALTMYLTIPNIFQKVFVSIKDLDLSSLSATFSNISNVIYLLLFTPGNLNNFLWWIFIILSSSIALHMSISTSDIKNSLNGILFVLGTMLIVNIVIGFISLPILNSITNIILGFSSYIIALLGISLVMSIATLLIAIIYAGVKKGVSRK